MANNKKKPEAKESRPAPAVVADPLVPTGVTPDWWGEAVVPVRVPISFRRRLRIVAAHEDKPLQDVIAWLLDGALKKRGA